MNEILAYPQNPDCAACRADSAQSVYLSTSSIPSIRVPFLSIGCLPIKELIDSAGLEAVILDAGGILVRHDSNQVGPYEEYVVCMWKKELRVRVGVLTNSEKEGRVAALENALKIPVYAAPKDKKKPNPNAYDEILHILCVEDRPDKVLAVGDRKHDIEAGNQKGMLTAFVYPFPNNNDPSEISDLRPREFHDMFRYRDIVKTIHCSFLAEATKYF